MPLAAAAPLSITEAMPAADPLAELCSTSQSIATPSGRSVEVWGGPAEDRVLIRSSTGNLVLSIELTDAGPRLRFQGAELELVGSRRVAVVAPEVHIAATRNLSLSAMGDVRVEGSAIELQASDEHVRVRAAGKIGLDGEHIGLNDDTRPRPFPWSRAANEL